MNRKRETEKNVLNTKQIKNNNLSSTLSLFCFIGFYFKLFYYNIFQYFTYNGFSFCKANLFFGFVETSAATIEWNITVGYFPIAHEQESQCTSDSKYYCWWTTEITTTNLINSFNKTTEIKVILIHHFRFNKCNP